MLPHKNLSCSLSLLHENNTEIDTGTSKAEKQQLSIFLHPKDTVQIN